MKKQGNRTGKQIPGVYTVEASIIVPLLVFLIAFSLRIGMEQFEVVKHASEQITAVNNYNPVVIFRGKEKLEDLLKTVR